MKKKYITSGILLAALMAAGFYGFYLYSANSEQSAQLVEQISAADDTETDMNAESKKIAGTASISEVEREKNEEQEVPKYKPEIGKLNMAYYPVDFLDESQEEDNCAQYAIRMMCNMDNDWMNSIYSSLESEPEHLLSSDDSADKLLGKYNPHDNTHDITQPNTWKIHQFHNIQMDVVDGDGHPIALQSNVMSIVALADVYTYFEGSEDTNLFLSLAENLWKRSHQYELSVSDVYYCSGCVDKEMDSELSAEELPDENQDESEDDMVANPNSDAAAEIILESEADDFHAADSSEQSSNSETKNDNSGSGLEESTNSGPDQISLEQDEENKKGNSAVQEQTGSQEYESSQEIIESEQEIVSAASESDHMFHEGEEEQTELRATASNADSEADSEADSKNNKECYGHVDLVVKLKINGLHENHGLYEIADSVVGELNETEPENIWDEEKRRIVDELCSQDWTELYDIDIPNLMLRSTLTKAEIEEYLQRLPEGLSEERKKVVVCALESIGRIPYHFGGKPAGAGYENNYFGSSVSPDVNGRTRRGLDCSGWINWVYWTATGTPLTAEGTAGLVHVGTAVEPAQLQPGDFAVRLGKNSHAVMFLGWMDDETFLCVHESSYGEGNVMTTTTFANWPYYRKVFDD